MHDTPWLSFSFFRRCVILWKKINNRIHHYRISFKYDMTNEVFGRRLNCHVKDSSWRHSKRQKGEKEPINRDEKWSHEESFTAFNELGQNIPSNFMKDNLRISINLLLSLKYICFLICKKLLSLAKQIWT